MSLEQFLNMGGYAFYVWTSYGLVLAVLILNVALPLRRHAEMRRLALRFLQHQARKQR